MKQNIFEEKIIATHRLLSPSHKAKKCHKNYRVADLVFNKYDILKDLSYTKADERFMSFPEIQPLSINLSSIELPDHAITFSKSLSTKNYNQLVVFYEADVAFARVLHNPKRYIDHLKKFAYVVGPDYSQKIGYPNFVNYENNWWNKALSAFYQQHGVRMIANVSWSNPASFSYAFLGIPKHSVIGINCSGIVSNDAAKYLWRKGYEKAIELLEPLLIIRYGDRMPGEREDISVYFDNSNLKKLRNGR